MKLRTIIVEDEPIYQKILSEILSRVCKDLVEIVDITSTVDEAVSSIKNHKPQLVFLDIQLEDDEDGGFEILRRFDEIDFMIVFTTGDNSPSRILSAVNVFDAVKYLVKPLKPDDVFYAVEKVKQNFENKKALLELNILTKYIDELTRQDRVKKVPVKQPHRVLYLPYNSVVLFRSDGNNCIVFTDDCKSMESIFSLRYYEDLLQDSIFLRVANSHIINMNHVLAYLTEDGGTIHLSCDCWAPLRMNKDRFFGML